MRGFALWSPGPGSFPGSKGSPALGRANLPGEYTEFCWAAASGEKRGNCSVGALVSEPEPGALVSEPGAL
ncbi:hypothetical protein IOD13_16295 [Brevibacterium casei]|nr:hypothetical protein [Brevibacterium casei]